MSSLISNCMFSSKNMSKTFVPPLNTNEDKWKAIPLRGAKKEQYGHYFAQTNRQRGQAHPDMVRAMMYLCEANSDAYAVLKIGTQHYASESTPCGETVKRIISASFSNGTVSAAEQDTVSNKISSAETIVVSKEYDYTGFFLCLIQMIWELAESNTDIGQTLVCVKKETVLSYLPDGALY